MMRQLIVMFYLAIVCLPAANAVDARQYLLIFTENRSTDPVQDVGTTDVSGVGMEWWGGKNNASFIYTGFTVGYMESDQVVSAFGDRNIGYPVYLHFGISMPLKITPYFEYGVELGAVIFNETLEGEEANTDTYVAGGVAFKTKAVLLKVYAKEYRIKPYGLLPVDVYVAGVSVGLEF